MSEVRTPRAITAPHSCAVIVVCMLIALLQPPGVGRAGALVHALDFGVGDAGVALNHAERAVAEPGLQRDHVEAGAGLAGRMQRPPMQTGLTFGGGAGILSAMSQPTRRVARDGLTAGLPPIRAGP